MGAENVGQTRRCMWVEAGNTVKHNCTTENNGSVCCVRGWVLLVSPLSFAGQPGCWLICSSCNKACCLYVNVQACVSASAVAPSKILAFGVCPSCCLLDLDLLLACAPISTFRHITCALLSRDGAQSHSLMLRLSFWMIPCTRPHWKRTTVFTPAPSVCFFS